MCAFTCIFAHVRRNRITFRSAISVAKKSRTPSVLAEGFVGRLVGVDGLFEVVWMMVTVRPLELLDCHAEEFRCLP